jgi:hypothetical protein
MAIETEENENLEPTRWYKGLSWLIAGMVVLFMGLIALGGGAGITFLSIPFFLTAVVKSANTLRIISIIFTLLALFIAWNLYRP